MPSFDIQSKTELSEVENALTGLRVRALDDERVDVANGVRDPLVGPVAPDDALPCLQLCECHWLLLVGRRP